MSNTHHHRDQRKRHQGEDLWSKRPGGGHASYCAFNKRQTAKKERARDRLLVHRSIHLPHIAEKSL